MIGGYATSNQMRFFNALSWALVLFSGFLSTSPGIYWNYEIPLLSIFFTLFYAGIAFVLKSLAPKEMNRIADGYPVWTNYVGVVHGGVVLPILVSLAIYYHPEGSNVIDQFMNSTFWVSSWNDHFSGIYLKAMLCAVNGYLLKDYFMYPNGLEHAFVFHHVVAVIGCCICFGLSAFVGAVAFNAMQCEFGSALFSIATIYPLTSFKYVYWFLMNLSNYLGMLIAYKVFQSAGEMLPSVEAYLYFSAATLLCALRTGGIIIDVKNFFSSSSKLGSSSGDVVSSSIVKKKKSEILVKTAFINPKSVLKVKSN